MIKLKALLADRPPAQLQMLTWASVIVLLLLHVFLCLGASARMSPTYDEGVYVTGGYSYWAFHDFRLQPENGMLPQRYIALPVYLSSRFHFPKLDSPAWKESQLWVLSDEFLFHVGNDLDALLFRGRAAVALVGAAVCLLVFWWSKEIYGTAGGLLSLTLCSLSPTMLAHAGLMTSDMMVTLFLLLCCRLLWNNLHVISPANVAIGCLSVTGLFLSKFSAATIIPVAGLMVIARLVSSRPMKVVALRAAREVSSRRDKSLAIAALVGMYMLVSIGLLWAAYGFRYSAFAESGAAGSTFYKFKSIAECCRHLGAKGAAIQWMANHHLLPEAYLYGAAYILMHLERYAFWNGGYSATGWRLFFPYCFLVKTPLPLLTLAGTSAAAALRRLKRGLRTRTLYETIPLWSLIGVYSYIAISSPLNIGHRYLLPLYPPMFILCGAAAAWLRSQHAAIRMLLPVVLALFLLESGRAYPHYLAYFNQITGREHAYEHLVDSSLDWGQDLPGLKHWLDSHGWDGSPKRPVFLTYFGTAEPEHYGIRASLLPVEGIPRNPSPPRAGLYCVSATSLQCVYAQAQGAWTDKYEASYQALRKHLDGLRNMPLAKAVRAVGGTEKWQELGATYYAMSVARLMAYLRHVEPIDTVGYSILLFQVTPQDLNRALNEPLVNNDRH